MSELDGLIERLAEAARVQEDALRELGIRPLKNSVMRDAIAALKRLATMTVQLDAVLCQQIDGRVLADDVARIIGWQHPCART